MRHGMLFFVAVAFFVVVSFETTYASKCTGDQVLKMLDAGFSKAEIKEQCHEDTAASAPSPSRAPKAEKKGLQLTTPERSAEYNGMEFVLIPAGEFIMGSEYGGENNDEQPAHRVRISRPFYLGTYEVTQGQWEAVMRNNPSGAASNPNLPVENVSYEDVQKFIQKLNAQEGGTRYRLPTEAEWEYANRAGSTTAYSFGDDPDQLGAYAWYGKNSDSKTHPVGQRKPNAWGLYDMYGNVYEWVQDWYAWDYYQQSFSQDPQGPESGSARLIRGCSWNADSAEHCRSADRGFGSPGLRYNALGFRLLRTAS